MGEENLVKNPQLIQMVCVPIVCSFLQSGQDWHTLPNSVLNLLNQCAQEVSHTLDTAPLLDPITGHMRPGKPCAGCK